MNKSAILSADGLYRYQLIRDWTAGERRMVVTWIMLNPSTADHNVEDATSRKVIKFSRAWGFSALHIVNLYAFRSPYPKDLRDLAIDPVGPENDKYITESVSGATMIICAWGASNPDIGRAVRVLRLVRSLGRRPHALRITKQGDPGHPLYIPDDAKPFLFDA